MGRYDADFTLDMIADLPAVFARREALAISALAEFPGLRGRQYGPHPAHRLNLFVPDGARNAPVQMFIHGGFWKSLDADLFSFLAPGFVPQGVILAVIDYPLMPEARMAQVVQACHQAILWLHDNIANHGGDPARIHVSGNSAGGHLVAELAGNSKLLGKIKGGTAISGIFDLAPVADSFQNDDLCLTPQEVAAFSPLLQPQTPDVPMIVAVGGNESAEFHRQSMDYAAKTGTTSMVIPQTDHLTILLDGMADPASDLNRVMHEQMKTG